MVNIEDVGRRLRVVEDEQDLVAALNELLEALRAGVRVVAAYARGVADGTIRIRLRALGNDEARYCAVLSRAIRRLGAHPSTEVGAFLGKALLVEGLKQRLTFVNRGQSWVVRRIEGLLPTISDPQLLAALIEMKDTHPRNLGDCERLRRCVL